MILPPHILKYQKQLQELNKKNSAINKNEINEKNKNKEKEEKNEIKGKNKPSNKFLQTNKNNSSINLPPHLKTKEFTTPQNSNNTIQNKLISKKDLNNIIPISEPIKEEKIENSNIPEEESESEESSEKISQSETDMNKLEKMKLSKREEKMKENWRIYRKGAGVIWQDESLNEWPENDYRMFIGDLGNEVNDQVLANAFIKYPSFAKAKVIRNKITGKTKGYGFVSVTDVNDYIKIMREMNGKYVGNRPIRIKRSTWKDRSVMYSKSKMPEAVFLKKKKKGETINLPELTDMKLLKKDPTLGGILEQIK
jgi:RNA recognition motif-containing protein